MSKNPIFIIVLFLLVGCLPLQLLSQAPKAITFSFSLTNTAKTSAGVYTTDSILVRTLWSGVTYSSGKHTATWDGTDDNGRLQPAGNYNIKVLSNNVTYKWEGVIGNTSDLKTGDAVHRSYGTIRGMAITGNKAFTCAGYAEQTQSQAAFDIRDIQKRIRLFPDNGTNQNTTFIATDGENVYWAGYDPFSQGWSHNFVFVTKVVDNSDVYFSSGTSLKMTHGKTYNSVIDNVNKVYAIPTGMAVQKKGKYLFVAHGTINELHVIDKITGALSQNILITNIKGLAVDGDDNVWVINKGNTITKYAVNKNGTLTRIGSITGTVSPLAIAVSPDNSTVIVCDGGASQQLKAFSNSTGAALWTYGQKGGYMNSPDVTTNKFYFSDVSGGFNYTYVAFQSDGSFWVGDVGNYRNLHFAANRTYLNQVMYLPAFYSAGADKNNANRVFAEYLEFKVDYTKSLAGTNGSWVLVKNWRGPVPRDYFSNESGDLGVDRTLKSTVTLNNGRTYTFVYKPNYDKWALMELPPSGNIRITGIEVGSGPYSIGADGALNLYSKINGINKWTRSPLKGFDQSNNPQWGAAVTIATTPADPVIWQAAPPGEQTKSGIIIGFDNDRIDYGTGNNFHLGGVKRGANKWQWRTAKNTSVNYTGEYPKDGAYDIGNEVQYAGGSATVSGDNIFWNYHGEFWKNGQTNEFTHVYADGLMVGTFGTNTDEILSRNAPAEMAGNTMSIFITKDSRENTYIMGCDESFHGGIQRWKVTNLNSIAEQSTSVKLVTTNGLLGQYFDSANLDNLYLQKVVVNKNINLCDNCSDTPVNTSSDFSARWTGFIKPGYSGTYTFYIQTNGGARMWVDGQLIIDKIRNLQASEFTGMYKLAAGIAHPVRIEYSNTSKAAIKLLWSGANASKQIIPNKNFLSACLPDSTEGVDLLEGVPHNSILQNGLYGWKRKATSEDYTSKHLKWWSVETDIKTYGSASPDVAMSYAQPDGTSYFVSRSLGKSSGLTSWKISGKICFDNNTYNTGNNGVFFDVLDNDDKVISRFYIERTADGEGYSSYKAYGNTRLMSAGDLHSFSKKIGNKNQPIEVSATNGIINFKYAGFKVTDVVFDPSAKWQKPKTLRVYFKTVDVDYGRHVSLSELQFLRNYAGNRPKIVDSLISTIIQGYKDKTLHGGIEFIGKLRGEIKIYPNPVISNYLTVHFVNIQKGTYQVKVVSSTGQIILTKTINLDGNTSIQSFLLNGALAKGQYLLQIIGNGLVYSEQFIKM